MGKRDKRFDVYIANSPEFARPILSHLREVVHAACPEVEETIKWGHLFFMYQGMLCFMASFKTHCGFGFWRGSQIVDKSAASGEKAMGQFGRITAVSDLPSKRVLAGYVKAAMRLKEDEPKVTRPKRAPKKSPLRVPADLAAGLRKHKKAKAAFEAFAPSHRREYIEWITEAKRPETRAKRLATTLEWLAEGKSRNWKYEKY